MEIDIFSIVIVIIAFSFFIVPIIIDKMKKKEPTDEQE